MPSTQPPERLALPLWRPRLVFARDDSAGSDRVPDSPVNLLIVEDDYLVASQMEDALCGAGFAIAGVVASAEEAVEVAAAKAVSLAVMDVRLAGRRDGVDAAVELFKTYGIRSVFATAHSDAEIRKRAEIARPLAWLQKPYSMSSLVETIRDAVNYLTPNS